MADINKKCKDCGASFVITEANQKWFIDRNFNMPVRCPSCRKKRKAANNGGR